MISSWFSSLGNNFIERSKNPFLGTFALVSLAKNWEPLFALFNFDAAFTLEGKIKFIADRIEIVNFWAELFNSVMWTFLILVLTYFLINAARFITNMFEKRLSPLIYKWTDYKALVPKTEYQNILSRLNDLQEKLDKEVQEKIRIQKERDSFEDQVDKLNLEIIEIGNSAMGKAKDETDVAVKKRDAIAQIAEIINDNEEKDFQHVIKSSFTETKLNTNAYLNILSELIRLDIIQKISDKGNYGIYAVTDFGKQVIEETSILM